MYKKIESFGHRSSSLMELARLPLLVGVEDNSVGDVCSICLCEFVDPFTLPCGHRFHCFCLASVLQVSHHCPVCRVGVPHLISGSLASLLHVELPVYSDLQMVTATTREMLERLRRMLTSGDIEKIPFASALLVPDADGVLHAPEIRREAMLTLQVLMPMAQTAGRGCGTQLLQRIALHDPDTLVRYTAMKTLGEAGKAGDTECLQCLAKILAAPASNEEVRACAAEVLKSMMPRGNEFGMRCMLVALQDPDIAVRDIAMSAIRVTGPRGESFETLHGLGLLARRHEDANVRQAALELIADLEEIGGDYGVEVALAGMWDQVEDVQRAAVNSVRRLCRRGDARAVNTFLQLATSDCAEWLSNEAFASLVDVASKGDRAVVKAASVSLGCAAVQLEAARVIKNLAVRGEHRDAVITLLDHVKGTDEEAACLALESLELTASKSDVQVVAVLSALRESSNDRIQMCAAQTMQRLR